MEANGANVAAMVAANAVLISLIAWGIKLLIITCISLAAILFLQADLKSLPERYRQADINLIWLLLIPVFSAVWNFFVFPKVAKSYQAYFAEKGEPDVGDCGERLAMAYCIVTACYWGLCWVTCISFLLFIAVVVLLILSLQLFNKLKNRVTSEA